ncbi:hypothetical protein [Kribbella sp. NPDC000426]|uniref:PspA-associated protein PspAB n=1 Tax=Kribbella sp. NPDC000426 TaxID=3154255 RepID=UPI00332CFFD1
MGLLDILLGRSKAVPPNLDQLFSVPSAAITLETAAGYRPTGSGSVCFKAAEGGGFSALRDEVDKLLALDNGKFTSTTDSYGFTWLVRQTAPDDLETLVTDLHAVNTSLVDAGFGNALLCTLVAFSNGTQSVGLVYLYKRGTWYPFVPAGADRRDNATELQLKSVIGADLNFEQDLSRWFPIYGAPGL